MRQNGKLETAKVLECLPEEAALKVEFHSERSSRQRFPQLNLDGGPKQMEKEAGFERADFPIMEIGPLAGAIAHELRQPLGAIKTLAYYLKANLPSVNPVVAESLKLLEEQADLAERILSSLVSFARSGAPSKTFTDVNVLLADVLKRLSPGPQVRIQEAFAPNLPPAFADPFHVDRIVSNLIANGLESMEGIGSLWVSTRAERESVIVAVSDSGCGIEPDRADSVFDVFVTTKPSGTGLGLALCRELAAANGGSIGFKSQPGCGTTFELRLPAA